MELEQAKAKAKARLAWVAAHPDYVGEGDKVLSVLLTEVERLISINASLLDGGAGLITMERARQTSEEGWATAHDDEHRDSSLALAAACYATPAYLRKMERRGERQDVSCRGETPVWSQAVSTVPKLWPKSWSNIWWNPKTRLRDLVRSGALIAAEIDRLLRSGESMK